MLFRSDPFELFLRSEICAKSDGFLKTTDIFARFRESEISGKWGKKEFTNAEHNIAQYMKRLHGATAVQKRVDGGRFKGYEGLDWVE